MFRGFACKIAAVAAKRNLHLKALALRIFTISLSLTAMFRGFALQNRRRSGETKLAP